MDRQGGWGVVSVNQYGWRGEQHESHSTSVYCASILCWALCDIDFNLKIHTGTYAHFT